MGVAKRPAKVRRGFTLVELLLVLGVMAMLTSLLLPALGSARRSARLCKDLGNLSQIGRGVAAYGADWRDGLMGYSWTTGRAGGAAADVRALAGAGNNLSAARAQMIDILRARAPGLENFPVAGDYAPHLLYWHLPGIEYLSARLPEPAVVCPEDRTRLAWAADPEGMRDGRVTPRPADWTFGLGPHARWSFASSYEMTAAGWDRPQDAEAGRGAGPWAERRAFNESHFRFTLYYKAESARRLTEAAFPSGKALLYDAHQRHWGRREAYVGAAGAHVTVLAMDGAAALRGNGAANPGWHPREPASRSPHVYAYRPAAWEPPAGRAEGEEPVVGYFRWTRGGLKGIDFGAAEIDTGQGE